MQKNLSQENLDNNVHGAIWKLLGIIILMVGSIFLIWVAVSRFFQYKEIFLYFLKYRNQNE